jgi:hypothetical protein
VTASRCATGERQPHAPELVQQPAEAATALARFDVRPEELGESFARDLPTGPQAEDEQAREKHFRARFHRAVRQLGGRTTNDM